MKFTHTVNLHDMCETLPQELDDAIINLDCDREVEVAISSHHIGTTTATGPDPTETEFEVDAEDLAWSIISAIVTNVGELPLHMVFTYADEIRFNLNEAIREDIQKFMDQEVPDLIANFEDDYYE